MPSGMAPCTPFPAVPHSVLHSSVRHRKNPLYRLGNQARYRQLVLGDSPPHQARRERRRAARPVVMSPRGQRRLRVLSGTFAHAPPLNPPQVTTLPITFAQVPKCRRSHAAAQHGFSGLRLRRIGCRSGFPARPAASSLLEASPPVVSVVGTESPKERLATYNGAALVFVQL